MALESGGDVMVIDCGVTFPDGLPGVDVIHPDFRWLAARRDRLRGIVITHGHEDHIGALPYLLKVAPAPVHAPRYALALIERRLEEHEDLPAIPLCPTRPGARFDVGPFGVEPVRVTHSIVDATALILDTPVGQVIHTGDFKIDPEPPDGEHFDTERLRAAGDAGVRLLMSDSTNAWVPGETGSEKSAHDALEALVAGAGGRVVVALFASNNHRLRSLFQIARAHDRRVLLLGRSLHRHFEVARETGYLADPGSLLVGERDARDLPPSHLMVLATGTQGEPPAALARLAEDRHPALSLDEGDMAILSSRIIPGNEKRVYDLINALIRQGVAVHWSATDRGVHVSGHAHADEQRRMLRLVRPASFLPVHGTRMHLERHAALAAAEGVKETLVVENGSVVEVTPSALSVVDSAPVGRVAVDRRRELPSEVLSERATLGELGCAFAVVPVSARGLDGKGDRDDARGRGRRRSRRIRGRGRAFRGGRARPRAAGLLGHGGRRGRRATRARALPQEAAGKKARDLGTREPCFRKGRSMRRALSLFAAAALLACGGGSSEQESHATMTPRDHDVIADEWTGRAGTETTPTPHEQRIIDELARAAEEVRGLEFREPVPTAVQDRQAILRYLTAELAEEDLATSREVYVALGLLPPDLDIRDLLRRVLGEQVVGYYDPETDRFVIRDDVMRGLGRGSSAVDETRVTIVHELVHALQDQHLDLGERFEDDTRDTDPDGAYRAVVEGDATLAMIGYAAAQAGRPLEAITERPEQLRALMSGAMPVGDQELASAPAIVRVTLISSYLDGLVFSAHLHGAGGWGAIDEAHRHPPASSEQVLHPEKYFAHELPDAITLPRFAELEAAGWEKVEEDTLGEVEMKVYLGQLEASGVAEAAAAGWSGDRLRVYRKEGSEHAACVWFTSWDDEDEAQEAELAAKRIVASIPEDRRSEHRVERRGRALLIVRHLPPALHRSVSESFAEMAASLPPAPQTATGAP